MITIIQKENEKNSGVVVKNVSKKQPKSVSKKQPQMFQKTATAYSVALDGYNGMLKGKIDVISGLTTGQKIMMASLPFMPKKMILKQVRQMQEIKND